LSHSLGSTPVGRKIAELAARAAIIKRVDLELSMHQHCAGVLPNRHRSERQTPINLRG
jgi:hypothetical protein